MVEILTAKIRKKLDKIKQVRDVIFGARRRQYESRLEKLESSLFLLEQKIGDRLQSKAADVTELKTMIDSLEKKIKSLSLTFQNEHTDIRQSIERINQKVSNRIEDFDKTFQYQITVLQNDLSETSETLQDDVQNLRAYILKELDKRLLEIEAINVSKAEMAELLFNKSLLSCELYL